MHNHSQHYGSPANGFWSTETIYKSARVRVTVHTVNLPRLGFNFPANTFRAVDLPIPLIPTKPNTWPGLGTGNLELTKDMISAHWCYPDPLSVEKEAKYELQKSINRETRQEQSFAEPTIKPNNYKPTTYLCSLNVLGP
jgi:hypothetical protein